MWLCRCDCGKETHVIGKVLKRGDTKSCGCFANQQRRLRKLTHGLTGTRTHRVWWNIINRCNNPNVKSYKDYGGRGIRVCERWLRLENFVADVGLAPADLEIDRIDNDGNYEPGNCRWVTREVNARTRRSTILVTILGITKPVAGWIRDFSLKDTTIYARIRRGVDPRIAMGLDGVGEEISYA